MQSDDANEWPVIAANPAGVHIHYVGCGKGWRAWPEGKSEPLDTHPTLTNALAYMGNNTYAKEIK